MQYRALACLLLLAFNAEAAITYQGRASNIADNGSESTFTTQSITPAGGASSGDLCFLAATLEGSGGGAYVFSITAAAGQTWNSLSDDTGTYSRRTWWTTFNGTWSGGVVTVTNFDVPNANFAFTTQLTCFHPTTPGNIWSVDVAATNATYATPGGSCDVAVTGQTPTASASVVTIVTWMGDDDLTWALQTGGWTNPSSVTQIRNVYGSVESAISQAYKIQASASATGSVTNRQTANGCNGGWTEIVTFKETSSAPTFDSGPTTTPVDTNTFRVTYDASTAGDVLWCGAYLKDASTPTAAQVAAGTNAHGYGSETTTGAGDTFDWDVTDLVPFPVYDTYCVLDRAANYSSVGSQIDECLVAPTGYQFANCPTGLTSIAADSAVDCFNDGCDGETGVSPDVAVGDILVLKTTVSPGGYTLVVGVDGNLEYDSAGDESRQYALAGLVYDISAGAYHAEPFVWYNNNAAPVEPVLEQVYFIPVGIPMDPINLANVCTDADGDELDYEAVDPLPANLVITDNVLQGTLLAGGISTVTFKCVDIAGAATEFD